MVSAMLVHTIIGLVILLVVFITLCYREKVTLRDVLDPLRRLWWLFLITFIVHTVLSYRNTGLSISSETANTPDIRILSTAFFFVARMGLMLSVAALLFRVHPPQRYGQAFGRALSKLPFGRAGWSQLELTGTLAMRFIPFLQDETVRLKMAFASRGLAQAKGWRKRIISIEKLLFPLIISSLRRADNVALALEARGFNPQVRRTFYHDLPVRPVEVLQLVVFTMFCIAAPLV